MDILREKLRCTPMGSALRKGSKSNSNTETTNQDNRVTAGMVGLTGSDSNVIEVNDTDAVKAIAGMGAETIAKTGEAVVKLNQAGMDANYKAWDRTVQAGTQLVDKLIDASTTLGSAAISSFQPAENKANDTSLKLGMIAAAGVAATLLLSKTK